LYKLHSEQNSKAQRVALTAALDNTQFIQYDLTSAHVTYTNQKLYLKSKK